MQANQSPVVRTTIICSAILLILGFFAVGSINGNLQLAAADVPTAESIASAVLAGVTIPTAAEVAALVPTVDTSKADRVCELTDGCEYWESSWPSFWVNAVMDEDDDIEDALLDLLNLDEDDLESEYSFGDYDVFDVEVKETQVRDYSEDYEGAEGNWEVKVFARVTFQDADEDDDDHAYVVITSVFDEGEYDDVSAEEVPRNFEFE